MFSSSETMARQICQHVIGMNPTSVGNANEEIKPEVVNEVKEEDEATAATREEGVMADEDWGKMDEASHQQHNASSELVHQQLLTNPEVAVKDVLLEAGMEIKCFDRFEVGQVIPGE